MTGAGNGESAPPAAVSARLNTTIVVGSAAVLAMWVVVAMLAPVLAPHGQGDLVSDNTFDGPMPGALLGTDYLGRDILSRLLYGAGTTIGMGVAATALSHLLGISLGFIAALRGGLTDTVLSRVNDALLSIPHIMLGLVVIAALGSSIPVLIVTTGAMYASAVFRIARALAMDQTATEYVEVARARGEGTYWILRHEILPNVSIPLLTDFAIRLSFIILFMSGLSFLGLGVQPPMADWGSMVRENMEGLRSGSLATIVPAAAIASVTVALNLLVDGVTSRHARSPGEARE